ncbi:MAG: ATP-binding protein [Christensenellaceae bacterium]|jgi:DNA replication protein DnaC|nr:ATP-binding protein [Christensenellaceae bacterium]
MSEFSKIYYTNDSPRAKANNTISIRKFNAEFKARNDLQRHLAADNNLLKLYQKQNKLSLEASRQEVYGEAGATIARANADVAYKEYLLYLDSCGIKHDFDKPAYYCTTCNDTGFINNIRCDCFKQLLRDITMDDNPQLNTDIRSFIKLKPPKMLELSTRLNMSEFYEFLNKYSENYSDSQYKIILLTGSPGTGKTFALSVFFNKVIDDDGDILMISAVKLNELFLKTHLAPLESKQEILETIIDCDILIVDDLGMEPFYNNVTAEYLRNLLDLRSHLTTIFSTNLNSEEIRIRYGNSTLSRLYHKSRAHVVDFFNTVDIRTKEATGDIINKKQ